MSKKITKPIFNKFNFYKKSGNKTLILTKWVFIN